MLSRDLAHLAAAVAEAGAGGRLTIEYADRLALQLADMAIQAAALEAGRPGLEFSAPPLRLIEGGAS